MSETQVVADDVVDPISLEVLRNRLDAIIEEASAAIVRTAISPIVTSGDYAVSIFDGDGALAAAGRGSYIAGASGNSVRATIARYGDEIRPGDVFVANDPHNGGGLHAQDVCVLRPTFIGDERIAWVVTSAHMMDVGGMVPGSFASGATDCFAEALRLPPVRLFRAGVEVTDVWEIFRNNVRIAELVESDLRGLVAGVHVAQESVASLAETMGLRRFETSLRQMRGLTERELRKRIAAIADGTYRATTWAEWDDEFFCVPCALTIDGDRMIFDFDGAAPQSPHYFNSKPYIISSMFIADLAWLIAADLPYNEAIFACVEFRCPEGTVVNARPPAPVGASHMDVCLSASEMAMQCVRLALAASTESDASRFIAGWGGYSALGVATWSAVGINGEADTWVMQEGEQMGSSARPHADGIDLGMITVGREIPHFGSDIEVLEAWYPILVEEKRPQAKVGAGRWRSGAGVQMSFRPHGTDRLVGEMLGMRRWMPLQGACGGAVGTTTEFRVLRADGSVAEIPCHVSGVVVEAGDTFEFCLASGGGFGDPLDRDIDVVAADVDAGQLSPDDAADIYGVVVGDGTVDIAATTARRKDLRAVRLGRATPADRAASGLDRLRSLRDLPDDGTPTLPLYPGVVHRGAVAYAAESGTPLAVAPDHWTTGCAVLEERLPFGDGPDVTVRWYLDPETGRSLFVDVAPATEPRTFESMPRHWVDEATTVAGHTS